MPVHRDGDSQRPGSRCHSVFVLLAAPVCLLERAHRQDAGQVDAVIRARAGVAERPDALDLAHAGGPRCPGRRSDARLHCTEPTGRSATPPRASRDSTSVPAHCAPAQLLTRSRSPLACGTPQGSSTPAWPGVGTAPSPGAHRPRALVVNTVTAKSSACSCRVSRAARSARSWRPVRHDYRQLRGGVTVRQRPAQSAPVTHPPVACGRRRR